MTHQASVVVIGGGQAGLAAGYHLRRLGLDFVILEASPPCAIPLTAQLFHPVEADQFELPPPTLPPYGPYTPSRLHDVDHF